LKLKKQDATVSDADVDSTLEYVRKNYAKENKLADADVKLDDELAKNVSRMNSMAELKVLIKSNLEEGKKRDTDAALRDDVTKQLSLVLQADLPKGMIDREIENMISDLEVSLKRSRMTLLSYLSAVKKDVQKLKDEMKPAAETRIKAKLALEAISAKEKLAVDDADLDKEIESLAAHYGKTAEEYKAEISPEVMGAIKDYLLKEKAIDFVISKAKVEG
jgi:trigger factor